ncbi:MAG: hypothetical protein MJ066_05905 [Clostridia bacterium]|nr:hypothetical protein [Clostridia bacterium]
MKIIKKVFLIILSMLFIVIPLSSCKKDKGGVAFYAPDGAPALAISKYIYDKENFLDGLNVIYKVISSNEIAKSVQDGSADIIAMPINIATKLYNLNKKDIYKMVSVITHGNLYIVSKKEISLSDLKGSVVGVIGQGLVPDLTFKAILQSEGIEYTVGNEPVNEKVAIRYVSDASELLPLLKNGVIEIGLLPEPACTKLSTLSSEYSYRLDIQELYNSETKSYPQAVLMVKESILKKYPKLVSIIEEKFDNDNIWLVENSKNAVNSINSVISEGLTPSLNTSNITPSVIKNCNIYWQKSKDAKGEIENYINSITQIEPLSAKTVDDNFYNTYEK